MNPISSEPRPPNRQGLEGPAKWAAVAVLGSVGIIGVGKSLLTPPPATRSAPQPTSVTIAPAALAEPDNYTQLQSPAPQPAAGASPKPDQHSTAEDIGTRININTASADELDLLPHIGPVLAQRIIDDRQTNGPFRSVADIQRVRGIGPRTAEKLEDLVRFE